jgi:hypothetical protein
MREDCNALRSALAAVGDPSQHPLRGIEQTRWMPAWSQEFKRHALTLKSAIAELLRTADTFAAIIGFPPGFYDHADIPRLAHFGELLTALEAPDGILLLGTGSGDRARALRARTALQSRIRDKTRALAAQYDLKAASRLDFNALHREWKLATESNFLVRNGRQKKVRLSLEPYCSGPVPDDIGRDLIVLHDLKDLLAEAERLRPSFSGIERLFDTVGADSAATEAVVAWAIQMDAAIKALGARLDNAAQIFDQTVLLLTDHVDFVAPDGEAGRALIAFQEKLEATLSSGAALSISMNLPTTTELLAFTPGWDSELAEAIDRWTENLGKASQ